MVLDIAVCRAWYVLVEKTEASRGESLTWSLARSSCVGFVSCVRFVAREIDGGALANERLR